MEGIARKRSRIENKNSNQICNYNSNNHEIQQKPSSIQKSKSERIVLHLDVDSFYTAAECLRDDSLRDKPFVVRQGNSGGFVAVSYEARKFGIRKGDGVGAGGRANIAKLKDRISEFEARRRCSGKLIVKDMDTEYYREVSAKLLQEIEDIVIGYNKSGSKMVVEKASIDDFYIEFVTDESKDNAVNDKLNNLEKNCNSVPSHESVELEKRNNCQKVFVAVPSSNGRMTHSATWNNSILSMEYNVSAQNHLYDSEIEGYSSVEEDEEDDYLKDVCVDQDGPNRKRRNGNLIDAKTQTSYTSSKCLAEKMQQHISLPITVGVAGNKFLAKMVGALNKPGGITILHPCAVDALLRNSTLKKIPGFRGKLGDQVVKMLQPMVGQSNSTIQNLEYCRNNVVSGFDLRFLTNTHLEQLASEFGREKTKGLKKLGYGIDNTDVKKRGPPKMIISEKSFPPGRHFNQYALLLSKQMIRRIVNERSLTCNWPRQLVFKWRHGYNSLSTTDSKSVEMPPNVITKLRFQAQAITSSSPNYKNDNIGDDDIFSEEATAVAALCAATVPLHCEVTRLVVGATGFVGSEDRCSIDDSCSNESKSILSYFSDSKNRKCSREKKEAHKTTLPKTEATMPLITMEKNIVSTVNKITGCSPTPTHGMVSQLKTSLSSPVQKTSPDEDTIICPVCSLSIRKKNAHIHVESHFAQSPSPQQTASLRNRCSSKVKAGKKKGSQSMKTFFSPR